MVSAIDTGRAHGNLSSAIRLFVLDHYRTMLGSVAGKRSPDVEMAAQSASALRNGG
jgi:predicted DNA-binding ribbon-helix-helix protein